MFAARAGTLFGPAPATVVTTRGCCAAASSADASSVVAAARIRAHDCGMSCNLTIVAMVAVSLLSVHLCTSDSRAVQADSRCQITEDAAHRRLVGVRQHIPRTVPAFGLTRPEPGA